MGLRRCAKKAQDEWRKTKKNAETPLPRNAEAFQGKGIVLPWGRCILAERKGLEPSASGVTGRRYNRLNYRSGWWAVQDLNLWPPPCKGASLMRVLLYSKAGLLSTVFIHHHFLTHGMAHRSIQIFSTLLTFLVHNGKPVLRWKQRWIISCPSAQAARTARRTCSCSPSGSTAEKTREDLRLCRKTRRKEMADRP